MEKFSFDSLFGGAKKLVKKGTVVATAGVMLAGAVEGQSLNQSQPEIKTKEGTVINLDKCAMKSMENNGDMPSGFTRYLWGEQDASGKHFNSYASVFYAEKGQTKATLVTKADYPSAYNGASTDFEQINTVAQGQGTEGVIFCSGPYATSSDVIEGAHAINGKLNTNTPAPYGGVVYIDSTGTPQIINCRNADGKLDQSKLMEVENRAVQEQATFFQQKMIITDGAQSKNFDPTNSAKFEWRLMAETNNGKTIVINGTAKVTLSEELRMLLSMKDPSGNALIKDSVLFDTGALSEGKFRTQSQLQHDAANGTFSGYTMRDESYPEHAHVATLVIGTITTKAAINPYQQTTAPIRVTQPTRDSIPSEQPYTPPTAPVYQKPYTPPEQIIQPPAQPHYQDPYYPPAQQPQQHDQNGHPIMDPSNPTGNWPR